MNKKFKELIKCILKNIFLKREAYFVGEDIYIRNYNGDFYCMRQVDAYDRGRGSFFSWMTREELYIDERILKKQESMKKAPKEAVKFAVLKHGIMTVYLCDIEPCYAATCWLYG